MLGWGQTDRVRASATASSARSRDSYQHYAVALYRQALLTPNNPVAAGVSSVMLSPMRTP